MQFAVGKGKRSGAFFGVILNLSELNPVEMSGAMQDTLDHHQALSPLGIEDQISAMNCHAHSRAVFLPQTIKSWVLSDRKTMPPDIGDETQCPRRAVGGYMESNLQQVALGKLRKLAIHLAGYSLS